MATKTLTAATSSSAATFLSTDAVVMSGSAFTLTGDVACASVTINGVGTNVGILQADTSGTLRTLTLRDAEGKPGYLYVNASTASATTAKVLSTGNAYLKIDGIIVMNSGTLSTASGGVALVESGSAGTMTVTGDIQTGGYGTCKVGVSDGNATTSALGGTLTLSGLQWRAPLIQSASNSLFVNGGSNVLSATMNSVGTGIPTLTIMPNTSTNSTAVGNSTISFASAGTDIQALKLSGSYTNLGRM